MGNALHLRRVHRLTNRPSILALGHPNAGRVKIRTQRPRPQVPLPFEMGRLMDDELDSHHVLPRTAHHRVEGAWRRRSGPREGCQGVSAPKPASATCMSSL